MKSLSRAQGKLAAAGEISSEALEFLHTPRRICDPSGRFALHAPLATLDFRRQVHSLLNKGRISAD
jgi:hypothetical protein